MQTISGFPYFEVQFTKNGAVHDQQEVTELVSFLSRHPVSDMFVVAHGWNNDMDEARGLYRLFFERMREVLDSGQAPDLGTRTFAILGVLWPSKKFAEKELIPSGAAGAESPVTIAGLEEQLDDLKAVFDEPDADVALEAAKQLAPRLDTSPAARRQFADLLRSLLPQMAIDAEDASEKLFLLPGDELMQRLSKPVLPAGALPTGGTGGATRLGASPQNATGGAAFLGNFFSGMKSAARNLINFATYYQMKMRAGVVGEGLNQVLRELRVQQSDLKLHLIGHSFGARLVTAAAIGPEDQPPGKVSTLTLLQAAFSHYGFSDDYEGTKDGLFRRLVTAPMVSGPILISCTSNDRAVGLAYPLASLIAGQVAAALGDKNDRYGGIGRNGAQKTPEAVDGSLLPTGGMYQLQAGKLYNLNADLFVKDHSDICKSEIAYAVLVAVSTT